MEIRILRNVCTVKDGDSIRKEIWTRKDRRNSCELSSDIGVYSAGNNSGQVASKKIAIAL